MKVSEAKEKVCPFIQISESYIVVEGYQPKNINCICGDCMAWEFTIENEETDIVCTHESMEKSEDKSKITETHIKVDENIYGEYGEYTDRRYAIMKELPEDDKEGYCKRLSDDN